MHARLKTRRGLAGRERENPQKRPTALRGPKPPGPIIPTASAGLSARLGGSLQAPPNQRAACDQKEEKGKPRPGTLSGFSEEPRERQKGRFQWGDVHTAAPFRRQWVLGTTRWPVLLAAGTASLGGRGAGKKPTTLTSAVLQGSLRPLKHEGCPVRD